MPPAPPRQLAALPCPARSDATHDSLGSLDVLLLEQELPVEVAEVDRVEVEDFDHAGGPSAKARHDCEGRTRTRELGAPRRAGEGCG